MFQILHQYSAFYFGCQSDEFARYEGLKFRIKLSSTYIVDKL